MTAFISYSRIDSDFALRLAKDLKKTKYDVWFDQFDIPKGSRWDDEIQHALENCTAFLIILSPYSLQSQNVKDEVNYAIDEGKQILPIRIKECKVPFRLRRFQYVDFVGQPYDECLDEIMDFLGTTKREEIEPNKSLKGLESQSVQREAGKPKRDKAKRQTSRIATMTGLFPKAVPILRIIGILGTIAGLFWVVFSVIPNFFSLSSTAMPSATITLTPTRTPFLTLTPSFTPTAPLTLTQSFTPTVSLTPTPIPPSRILFQKNFEDGAVGGWLGFRDGVWAVEQEADGNHCLSGSGPAATSPQIWYTNQQIRWTDYALETRVKFTKGHILYTFVRSDVKSGEHYGVALNDAGFSLMRTWSTISKIISMVLTPSKWYTIKVEIRGDSFNAYIDNDTSLEIQLDAPVIQQGGFGYGIEDGENVCFDDITAWSLK